MGEEGKLSIQIKSLERVELMTVNGRVDSSSAPQLEAELTALLHRGRHNIVLDLTDVSYMSSAGLRVMVTALKAAKRGNGDLRLASLSQRVSEVLHLAGLSSIFKEYPTQLDAVGSF